MIHNPVASPAAQGSGSSSGGGASRRTYRSPISPPAWARIGNQGAGSRRLCEYEIRASNQLRYFSETEHLFQRIRTLHPLRPYGFFKDLYNGTQFDPSKQQAFLPTYTRLCATLCDVTWWIRSLKQACENKFDAISDPVSSVEQMADFLMKKRDNLDPFDRSIVCSYDSYDGLYLSSISMRHSRVFSSHDRCDISFDEAVEHLKLFPSFAHRMKHLAPPRDMRGVHIAMLNAYANGVIRFFNTYARDAGVNHDDAVRILKKYQGA